MALFGRNNGGAIADVIRCDEPDYIIWKWHPQKTGEGESKRENEIRFNSSLRVKDGSVAVFVYKQKDGTMQDFIEGPFDETIKTKNFPVLSGLLGLAFDGKSPFQAEVYFINLAGIIQVKFGVQYFDVFDPRFMDFAVPVSVRGTITFKVTDYKAFVKLHRLESFSLEDFQKQIRNAVSRYVKNAVSDIPYQFGIPVIQLERKIGFVNEKVESVIQQRLFNDFGVTVSGVDISSIDMDKSSEGYKKLCAVTQDVTTATIKAQTAANVKTIEDMQRINMENTAETMRIKREEEQYAQHMKTRSENVGAYQIERQTEVGIASAAALGEMGANGAGNVAIGGNGNTGFNPASMMASMALGGAIGQNIANTMNGILSPTASSTPLAQTPPPVQMPPIQTPPPIPTASYNVAINGSAVGPFDFSTLSQMAQSGQINASTLVWKPGMSTWQSISTIDELKAILYAMPPIIPGSN